MGIIHSKNYSIKKKLFNKIFIEKFENYSFKKIIHFFEKLIIAQGYLAVGPEISHGVGKGVKHGVSHGVGVVGHHHESDIV